jgi:hypothetical protein
MALIVLGLIGGTTVTIYSGADPTPLLSLGNLVMMAIVYGKVEAVQQQGNGQQHRLMSIVEKSVPSTVETVATQGVQANSKVEGSQ